MINTDYSKFEGNIIQKGTLLYRVDLARTTTSIACETASYFSTTAASIAKFISLAPFFRAFALALTVPEFFYEAYCLWKVVEFDQTLQGRTPLEKLEKLRAKYFTIDAKDEKVVQLYVEEHSASPEEIEGAILVEKLKSLSFRVNTQHAWNLQYDLNRLIKELKSDDQKTQLKSELEANNVITKLQTQNIKKLLIHGFAFESIVLSAIAIVLIFAAIFPPTSPFIIGLSALVFVLGVASVLLDNGVFTQEGWKFSLWHQMPKRLQNYFSQPKAAPLVSAAS